MAAAFGVSPDFMDSELADFIVAGRLPAKIDKVAGVVVTSRHAFGSQWDEHCLAWPADHAAVSLMEICRWVRAGRT